MKNNCNCPDENGLFKIGCANHLSINTKNNWKEELIRRTILQYDDNGKAILQDDTLLDTTCWYPESEYELDVIKITGFIKSLLAEQKKELMSEMLDFLKEPEEYCLQHYGYATDKQEDKIYTQGMHDFKAYKIIKLLNKIEKLKHHD